MQNGVKSFVFLFVLLFSVPQPCLAQSSHNAESEFKKGLRALYSKQYAVAIQHFESTTRGKNEISAKGYYYLGYTHYLRGNFSESRNAFRQAFEDIPNFSPLFPLDQIPVTFPVKNLDSLNLIGGTGKIEEPRSSFSPTPLTHSPPEQTLATPGNPHFKKGLALMARKDFSGAVVEFKAATEEFPSHPGSHFYMGYSLYQLKNYPGSRAAFQEAYRIQPDYLPTRSTQ